MSGRECSRRLWSLWDMLALNASPFYHATVILENIRGMIQGKNIGTDIAVPTSSIEHVQNLSNNLIKHLVILNTKISLIAALDLRDAIVDGATYGVLSKRIEDVYATPGRELMTTKLFIIENDRQRYYDPPSPLFGDRFQSSFLSAAFDLDEAAKCFAVSRPTACVFHLMRVMEIGIRAAARCLGLADPTRAGDRNWGTFSAQSKVI